MEQQLIAYDLSRVLTRGYSEFRKLTDKDILLYIFLLSTAERIPSDTDAIGPLHLCRWNGHPLTKRRLTSAGEPGGVYTGLFGSRSRLAARLKKLDEVGLVHHKTDEFKATTLYVRLLVPTD